MIVAFILQLSMYANVEEDVVRRAIRRLLHQFILGPARGSVHHLLIECLQAVTLAHTWLWPTLRKAKAILTLIAQVESICHLTQHMPSEMISASLRHETKTLLRLSQKYSYGTDILSTGPRILLTIVNNKRLSQVLAHSDDNTHNKSNMTS